MYFSAYKLFKKKEPTYTNFSGTFREVLDYIFISNHFKVSDVEELPYQDNEVDPFPNINEPSDHLMLTVKLEI